MKDSVSFHMKQIVLDPEGRFIILVCSINKTNYTIVNLYAPNAKQMRFLRKIMRTVQTLKQGHLIICGDFNLVPEVHLDSTTATKRRESPLKRFITTHELYDTWRCHHGEERDYTYFSPMHKTYSWIDLFLIHKWLLQKRSASTIHTTTWSDMPLSQSLYLTRQIKKKTFLWRANNYILQHPSYSPEITEHLTEHCKHNADSVSEPGVVWIAHKAYVKGILIKLSSQHKKQRSLHIDKLMSQITNLENLNKANPQSTRSAQILSLRQELRLHLLQTFKHTHR